MNSQSKSLWVLVSIILFWVVYQYSGTFVYIDGDDATSIAYHVMERNPAMQEPYSPYHGMMDKMLSLLPAQEELVRTVAFGATRLATVLMYILILLLVFKQLHYNNVNLPLSQQAIAAIVLLIAAPELFFFGLVYAPTMIAMCFVLCSHLLLYRLHNWQGITSRQRVWGYVLSIIVFGFGASFRWNVAAYGIIIAASILSMQSDQPLKNKIQSTLGWLFFAGLSSLVMISFSGYGFRDFLAKFETVLYVLNQAGTLSPESNASTLEVLMRTVLTLTPLFTPIFTLVSIAGLVKLIKEKSGLLSIVVAGLLSILPWLRSGVPKFIITALPVLILLFMAGLTMIIDFTKDKSKKRLVYILISIGLLLPWLVGVQIERGGTPWGPGFELKLFDYEETEGTHIKPVFGPGMAFPTPEGIRPLYGYAYVFFREWRSFNENSFEERKLLLDTALQTGSPLVTTSWSPDYYLNDLYARGYRTSDPYDRIIGGGFFTERRFENSQGQTISILYAEVEGEDISVLIEELALTSLSKEFVLTGYPRTMRDLYEAYPNALQKLGPTSVVLDLEKVTNE